ncbi:inactive carboxypeptidase-like protein X2, partial [Tachysurus ichikawai]
MLTHTTRVSVSLIAVFLLLDITNIGGSVIGETRRDDEEKKNLTATEMSTMLTHTTRVSVSLIAVFLLLDITNIGGSVIGETRRDDEEKKNLTATGTDED